MKLCREKYNEVSLLENKNVTYEIIKKKYRNLLILKDFGYCEPDYFSCSCCDEEENCSDIGIPKKNNVKGYNFGCGKIENIASFSSGETVLDLGCGCGNDCIIAARAVGDMGKVIGVDILPEMISRAKEQAVINSLNNIEFIESPIENIPLLSNSVDVIISNCVINLSPNKVAVYSEISRLLKPLGRIVISDIITLESLSLSKKNHENMLCACLSGAMLRDELEYTLKSMGFIDISIELNKINTNSSALKVLRRAYITATLQA